MSSSLRSLLSAATHRLRRASSLRPELALVLGSGFGGVADAVEVDARIPYDRLPGFPKGRVSGHAGQLLLGRLADVPVIVLCGRAHYYEGFDLEAVTYPVRVLAEAGVGAVLLTNAAGGIASSLRPGDFMVLEDHLNFLGENPLRPPLPPSPGKGPSRAPFVDLSAVYDEELRRQLLRAGRLARVRVRSGVYLAVSGPSYETPAEIRAFARWGADAVGMSTVPEAIVARSYGLRVAGLSCISNRAAGLGRPGATLSHEEVLATARKREKAATDLVTAFVRRTFGGGGERS